MGVWSAVQVVRGLNDKIYDKRKAAALDVERCGASQPPHAHARLCSHPHAHRVRQGAHVPLLYGVCVC
jgi:ABC-type nickel/cobalt efflux system permease component RcnA